MMPTHRYWTTVSGAEQIVRDRCGQPETLCSSASFPFTRSTTKDRCSSCTGAPPTQHRPRRRHETSPVSVEFVRITEGSWKTFSHSKDLWQPLRDLGSICTKYLLFSGCGGDYYIGVGNQTVVTSPGYPEGYETNLFCVWTLVTDEHYRIALTLNTLDIEAGSCRYDKVMIYDGRKNLRSTRRWPLTLRLTTIHFYSVRTLISECRWKRSNAGRVLP